MRKGISNFMDWDSIGCEVAGTASDGLEAIQFLRHNHVDIVITDIKMPEADGLAVAKFVFENLPDVKVILLTGYADFKYAQTAIQYNVSDFILKPTNKKDLFSSVKTAQQKIIAARRHTSFARPASPGTDHRPFFFGTGRAPCAVPASFRLLFYSRFSVYSF